MQKILAAAIGLATLPLAATYGWHAEWAWVAFIVLVGLLWLTEARHGQRWLATVGLLCFATLAAVGIISTFSAFWLLTSLVAALCAWDLSHFTHKLNDITDIRKQEQYIRAHLQRLGIVAALGWLLGLVALNLQLTVGFISALALAFLVIISLSGIIRYLQRESD